MDNFSTNENHFVPIKTSYFSKYTKSLFATFNSPQHEFTYQLWKQDDFDRNIRIISCIGFFLSIIHPFLDIWTFCETTDITSPSLCNDTTLGPSIFKFRLIFFPLLHFLLFFGPSLHSKSFKHISGHFSVVIMTIINGGNFYLAAIIRKHDPLLFGQVDDTRTLFFIFAMVRITDV